MRNFGLPRINKPFPTAADSHFPAVDMAIRRLKPFWIGQVTSGDRLCSFSSLKQQLEAFDDCASDFFNFELIQRSDFMRKLRVVCDYMLLRGRGVIKATVDPMDKIEKYPLVFEAIDPIYILMPQSANGFEDADEFVHCRNMTVEAYLRLDDRYNKDPGLIRRIRGSQDFSTLGLDNLDIRLKQGIAFSNAANRIVIFEHYIKNGSGWMVQTYCPSASDEPLRKGYGVPYKVGGKTSIPFYSFQMEVCDEGWYAPRGLGELLGPVEQYMTKLWNSKADFITFANTPLYTGEKEIVNSANYRFQPGEYIPGNIKSVGQSAPPIDFDREIMFARGIAEEQSQSPDYGLQKSGGSNSDPRTAREISAIGSLQAAGTTDNANMFREDLTKLYRHVWGLLIMFKERDFSYYTQQEIKQLPPETLHDQYLITPDGSPENWNRMARLQKAIGLQQATQGNPNVDQEPITKELLTAYDGRMAQKAFIPTNLRGANEYEEQVVVINTMLCPGGNKPAFPAPVRPNEDHVTRIKANLDWMHGALLKGTPVDPQSRTLLHQNISQHLEFLKQQNPSAVKQVEIAVHQLDQSGSQPNGQQIGGPNSQPADTTQMQQGATGAQPSPVKESVSINYKDAPPDIQRQMEKAAGFIPSQIGTQPQFA